MKRVLSLLFTMIIVLSCVPIVANADVAGFGTTGSGGNPFNPRGYYVELSNGSRVWLSSKFQTPLDIKGGEGYDNLGHQVVYTGSEAGLDYVDAELITKLYAQTDRNPTPGYKYLVAYSKNSISDTLKRIDNFSDYLETPVRSSTLVDPNGQGNVWHIPITMTFEPGTVYEFAFLRGMQANNGITCVISEDKSGYIRTPITSEEQVIYDKHKNDEYEYLTSATQNANGEWQLSFVPMRYRVQTYADLTVWEEAVAEAQQFLDSVTPESISSGRYTQSNIDELQYVLDSGNAYMESVVKKQLQVEADNSIAEWVQKLNDSLYKAENNIVERADLTEYNEVLKEAKSLYNKTKDKVGTKPGQYGATQVTALKNEISTAEKTIDETSKQVDVDTTVTVLKQAILAVKSSRVTEDEIRFYDPSTGIAVIVPKGGLPDGARLYVGEFAQGALEYDLIEENLGFESTGMVLYKIAFFINNKEVHPSKIVEIQIPVVSSLDVDNTSAFAVDSKYKCYNTNAMLMFGTHVFSTNEMGLYAIIEYSANDGNKNDGESDISEILNKENTQDNQQQEMNELVEEETKDKETPENEPKDYERENPLLQNIDFSKLTKDFESSDLVYVGIGVAGFGILMGILEFVRGKRDNDMFV